MRFPKVPNIFTRREIETLLRSRILGDPSRLYAWIDRFFAMREIVLGISKKSDLHISEIKEILNRSLKVSQVLSDLSKALHRQSQFVIKSNANFMAQAKSRKNSFSLFMKIIRTLLQNANGEIDHDLPIDLLLEQYELWEGLEEEIGSHYIKAGYLANRVLLGKSEDNVKAPEVLSLLANVESVYHLVTDINALLDTTQWTPKESVLFLRAYQKLLNFLFKLFLESGESEIKETDLVNLLELLHADVQGKASQFVHSILKFKTRLLGGSENAFVADDLVKLMSIFDETTLALERSAEIAPESNIQMTQGVIQAWLESHRDKISPENVLKMESILNDFPKTLYLWTTPYQKTDAVNVNNFSLTQIAFVLVDHVIGAYDKNGDHKLSLADSKDGRLEIGHGELLEMVQTIQGILTGLDLLTEGVPSSSKPLLLKTESLGKLIVTLADQLLYNANADSVLDRYEIMEVASFLLENSRAATWFYWDPAIEPYRVHPEDELKRGLLREGLSGELKKVATLQWYFPNAMNVFSDAEVQRYVQTVIETIGRDDPKIMSVEELETLFALVRLMETMFLKFDLNQDAILDKSDLKTMSIHFKPFVVQAMRAAEEDKKKSYSLNPLKAIGTPFRRAMEISKEIFLDDDSIYERSFFYALTNGKSPSNMIKLFFFHSKPKSDRIKVANLFMEILKENEILN